ncbi:MAG: hypothetical protein ACT4PO_00130 [Actinomycetota bacterium]
MSMPLRGRAFAIGCLAWAGVVASHLLAYVTTYPTAALRQDHLAATGHGSFDALGWLAIVGSGASIGLVGWQAARRAGPVAGRRTALALVSIQLPAFALLELAERGFSLADTAADPAVLVGVVLQAAVAASIAFALRAFVRAVRAVAERLRQRVAPRRPTLRRPPSVFPARRVRLHLGARRRAPPLLAS